MAAKACHGQGMGCQGQGMCCQGLPRPRHGLSMPRHVLPRHATAKAWAAKAKACAARAMLWLQWHATAKAWAAHAKACVAKAMPWLLGHSLTIGEDALGMLPTTWRFYPPRGPSSESSSSFVCIQFSDLIFGEAFGGLLVVKMGHAAYRWKSREVYFPTI